MKRSNKGFTLVEVLASMVFIGLAAGAAASGLRATTNLLGENALHAQAITLAQRAMEDLRTVDYEDIAGGSSQSEDGTFTVAWQVSNNFPERGMKFITVSTVWSWKGEPRSYALHTIYSQLTLN